MAHFRLRCPWLTLVTALVLIFGFASVAYGHAVLLESTPKANSTVKGPELAVDLKFNSRIDGSRSRLVLVLPDGSSSTLSIAKQTSPDHLLSKAADLKPGAYKLQWTVLASDGHITHGEVPFTVS
ncbi:MAG: copper resistance CopC family protein [Candidatus Acidiferrales bacterium]